jgi:hypothetical protein
VWLTSVGCFVATSSASWAEKPGIAFFRVNPQASEAELEGGGGGEPEPEKVEKPEARQEDRALRSFHAVERRTDELGLGFLELGLFLFRESLPPVLGLGPDVRRIVRLFVRFSLTRGQKRPSLTRTTTTCPPSMKSSHHPRGLERGRGRRQEEVDERVLAREYGDHGEDGHIHAGERSSAPTRERTILLCVLSK